MIPLVRWSKYCYPYSLGISSVPYILSHRRYAFSQRRELYIKRSFITSNFACFLNWKKYFFESYFSYHMSKQFRSRVIFLQATLAMIWSLYYSYFGDPVFNAQTGDMFSLVNWLAPCELCRYARILMYPLVIISWVGLWQKSTAYVKYVLPFALLGIFLETYHYILQKTNITTSFTCTFTNPCNALQVNYFGFITIPLLCFVAFLIILIATLNISRKKHTA